MRSVLAALACVGIAGCALEDGYGYGGPYGGPYGGGGSYGGGYASPGYYREPTAVILPNRGYYDRGPVRVERERERDRDRERADRGRYERERSDRGRRPEYSAPPRQAASPPPSRPVGPPPRGGGGGGIPYNQEGGAGHAVGPGG